MSLLSLAKFLLRSSVLTYSSLEFSCLLLSFLLLLCSCQSPETSSTEDGWNGHIFPYSLPIITLQKTFVKQFWKHFADFLRKFRKKVFLTKKRLARDVFHTVINIIYGFHGSFASAASGAVAVAVFGRLARGGIHSSRVGTLRPFAAGGAGDFFPMILDKFLKILSAFRTMIL